MLPFLRSMSAPLLTALLLSSVEACPRKAADDEATQGQAGSAGAAVAVDPDLGKACDDDAACGEGLICGKTFAKACTGPIKAHDWSLTLKGGFCSAFTDIDSGVLEACPAGSKTINLVTGCDTLKVFRWCTPPCEHDADCRVSDGYYCNLEALACYPEALKP